MPIILIIFLVGFAKKISDEVDESLIKKIGQDNSQAFEEFYKQTYKALYAYVLSIAKNHDNTLDIMQDTYLKIKASAHLYKPMGKPLAWIFVIARNLCMDSFNKDKKYVDIEDNDMENSLDFSYVKDPMDRLVLESSLKILSTEEIQIVLLYAVKGYKHREIADLLNMKQNTIISKYNRALKKLRDFLGEEEANEGKGNIG